MAKILIFGDSQAAGAPGSAAERALKAAGNEVRRFGNVGRGPADYVRDPSLWSQYTRAVADFAPDAVLAVFGSNDVANAALEQGMIRIRDAVRPPVFFSGPPQYPNPTNNMRGAAIRDMAKAVWGDERYIDAYPWTAGAAGRAADGLHFTASGGERWGAPLASELSRRLTGVALPLPSGHARPRDGGGPGSRRRPSARRGSVVVDPSTPAAAEEPEKP
jgi:lysophospholipase L1-like esterase